MDQYSGKANECLEESIDQQISKFIALIEEEYISEGSSGRPLDMALTALYFTMDMITDVSFGKAFGFLTTNSDVYNLIEANSAAVPYALTAGLLPQLVKVLHSPLLRGLLPSAEDKIGFGVLMRLVFMLI